MPWERMHGGAIASLADSAVAMALIPWSTRATGSRPLNSRSICGARGHGKLTAQAQNPSTGAGRQPSEMWFSQREGKLVAKVMATYSIKENGLERFDQGSNETAALPRTAVTTGVFDFSMRSPRNSQG